MAQRLADVEYHAALDESGGDDETGPRRIFAASHRREWNGDIPQTDRRILFGLILTHITIRQSGTDVMDDVVIRAMAKWPNVPVVYGWLALDRRGRWSIKTGSPGITKGGAPEFEPVANQKLIEFIGRNYAHDAAGCWYFQNGPQRVYVELAYTPYIYRIARAHPLSFETHTGSACATLRAVCMDENGNLLLVAEHGPGLLLDRDLPRALAALVYADGHALEEERLLALIETGSDAEGVYFSTGELSLPLALIKSDEAPARFGYVRAPIPPAAPGMSSD